MARPVGAEIVLDDFEGMPRWVPLQRGFWENSGATPAVVGGVGAWSGR